MGISLLRRLRKIVAFPFLGQKSRNWTSQVPSIILGWRRVSEKAWSIRRRNKEMHGWNRGQLVDCTCSSRWSPYVDRHWVRMRACGRTKAFKYTRNYGEDSHPILLSVLVQGWNWQTPKNSATNNSTRRRNLSFNEVSRKYASMKDVARMSRYSCSLLSIPRNRTTHIHSGAIIRAI